MLSHLPCEFTANNVFIIWYYTYLYGYVLPEAWFFQLPD